MLKRILWAYIGAFGLPLLFLPIAFINEMDDLTLVCGMFCMSPLGIIIMLADHDSRQHIDNHHKLYRSILATILLFIFLTLLAAAITQLSTYVPVKYALLLMLFVCPVWVAALSHTAFRNTA